jgi:hypothetical protein
MAGEPGNPPPALVDRAYDVGAHATAAPAAPATFADRRGLIRAFGIIQIVFGGICALMTVVMIAVVRMMKVEAGAMIAGLVYAIPATNLLVTGIGSVKIARWARLATIISACLWLPLMLLAAVGVAIAPRNNLGPNGSGLAIFGIVMVLMLLLILALPVTLIVVYTRPSVRATFEGRQAS